MTAFIGRREFMTLFGGMATRRSGAAIRTDPTQLAGWMGQSAPA